MSTETSAGSDETQMAVMSIGIPPDLQDEFTAAHERVAKAMSNRAKLIDDMAKLKGRIKEATSAVHQAKRKVQAIANKAYTRSLLDA